MLDSGGFLNGLKSASDAAQSIGGKIGSAVEQIGKVSAAAFGAATTAAVAFGKDAVNVGQSFDASMANVAAISGATADDLNKLREEAIKMGGSTKFSATEAADALGYMAMAGWDTEQMTAGLKGVMDLAAASGTDLATTSDIVTDALTAFGLEAQDSSHFADILAVASSKANTNVQMMGETFKYVAPLAGTLKMTAEDVAEAVGLMANAGIKSGQAGTALRAALTRLAKPTSDMIPIMEQLGLAVSEISAEEAQAQTEALEQSLKGKKKAYADDEDALQESLDRQYDALKKSLDARYDAQKEAFDNAYDARKDALDKEYDALEKSLDDELSAVEKSQEKRLSEVQKAQEAEVKAHEDALERKLKLIDEEYTESLRLTNEAEYNRIKALDDQIAAIEAESEREQKAAEEAERAQRRAELQKAIDAADSAEKREEAERKLAEYNEKIRQKDAEAARKAQISDLKAQKDAAKEAAKAERDAAKEKRDAKVQAEKDASEAALDEIKARQKSELAELKDGQKREFEELKASHKEKLAERKAQNAQELEALKKAQSDQLAAVKDGNDETLKETKRGYDKQLEALKESNKDKLSEYQDYVTEQKKAIKEASKSAQSLIMTDENGNMRELIDDNKEHLGVINLLKEAFAGLSEAEQVEAAATLFGQEAMSGMLAVLNAAPSDVEKLESALRDCEGAAAEMALTHENSLAGSITTFGSALETLKIRISDTLTPTLRQFTKFGQESVVALTEGFQSGGFSGMMDALGPVISDGIGMLMGYVPKIAEVGGQLLGAVMTGIVNNFPLLADGALKLATSFGGYLLESFRTVFSNWGLSDEFDAVVTSVSETFEKVRDAVTGAFDRIRTALSDAFGDYFSSGQAAQDITNLLTIAIELFGDAVSVAANLVATAVEKITEFVKWLSEGSTGADLFTAAVAGVTAAFVTFKAALAINTLIGQFQKAIEGARLAFKGFNAIMAANPLILVATLIAGVVAALIVLWNTNEDFRKGVIGIWGKIKDGIAAAWEGIKKASAAAWEFIKKVFAPVGAFFKGVWDTIINLLTPVLDAVKAAFSLAWTIVKGVWSVATAFFGLIWDGIQAVFSVAAPVLEGFFSLAWEGVKAIWSVATFWFGWLWDGIKAVFSVAEAVIGGFFSTAWAAVKLVWNAATGFFQNIWDSIAKIFSAVESVLKGDFSAAFEAIKGVFSGWGDFFQGLWDDLTNVFSHAFDWFKDVGSNIVNGLKEGIGGLWDGFLSLVGVKTDEVKEEFTGPDGFDEHSPSKWAKTVFQRILEGGEIGLTSGLPSLLSSAENAVQQIQDSLTADPFSANAAYEVPAPAYRNAPAPRPARAAYENDRRNAINSNPTINISMTNEVGGRKVAYHQTTFTAAEVARRGPALVNL